MPVAFALLGLGLLVICVGKWPRVRPGRRLVRVVAAFGVVAVGGLLGARAIGLELAVALCVLAGIATAATDRNIAKPPRP